MSAGGGCLPEAGEQTDSGIRASADCHLASRLTVLCFPLLFAALTGRSGHGLAQRVVTVAHRCQLSARPLS